MYRFDIITLFPNLITPYLQDSILKIATDKQAIQINCWNPRDYTKNKHKKVDDTPYGGGAGMVLSAQPFYDCIQEVKKINSGKVIYLTPTGKKLRQTIVEKYAKNKDQSLILICGRYEGLDQRVVDLSVDECISIGDYVLAGGEIAALVLTEAVSRLVPGVLGSEESHQTDSFSKNLHRKKQHPVYTKPATFKGLDVPATLLSGNHAEIEKWKLNNLR